MLELLGISGSVRRQSTNTAVLSALADRLGDKARLTLFDVIDVPIYNGDCDIDGGPASVRALREAIGRAHGLVLCSPEYNHGPRACSRMRSTGRRGPRLHRASRISRY